MAALKPSKPISTLTVREGELCPIVEAIRHVAGVWRLVVVRYLMDHPQGFNDLLKTIPASNSKTLSRTLKLLMKEGLIERKILSLQPFAVQYSLTQKGRALEPVLNELKKWGERWAVGLLEEQPRMLATIPKRNKQ